MADRLHRVFVTGEDGGRPLVWAAFRTEVDANIYADDLRVLNPTWIVNYETLHHRIDGRRRWRPLKRTA